MLKDEVKCELLCVYVDVIVFAFRFLCLLCLQYFSGFKKNSCHILTSGNKALPQELVLRTKQRK